MTDLTTQDGIMVSEGSDIVRNGRFEERGITLIRCTEETLKS